MNKRVISGILLILILASLLVNVSFVSADEEDTKFIDNFVKDEQNSDLTLSKGLGQVGNEIGGTLKPILLFLFNIEKDASKADIAQTLFSFIIAFIIVFVFVLVAFKNLPFFDENRGLSYFMVIVATLLGIRGIAQISPSIMSDIFLPYSALALTIINGAAIVAWFMLVNVGMQREDFSFIRRFLWILFAVTFIGIWGMRTLFVPAGNEKITALTQWIYWSTFILSIIMAIIDGSIQGVWSKMRADHLKHINKTKEIGEFHDEYKRYKEQLKNTTITPEQYKNLVDDLRKRVRILLGSKFAKEFKSSP